MSVMKKFIRGEKKYFPAVKDGQVLYATDENGLYLDNEFTRERLNPPADWNETDETSPSFIANKPNTLPSYWTILPEQVP